MEKDSMDDYLFMDKYSLIEIKKCKTERKKNKILQVRVE
jgi:hypothetical protein